MLQRGLRGHQARARTTTCAKGKGKPQQKQSAISKLLKKKQEAEAGPAEGPVGRATEAQWSDPEVRGLLFSIVSSYHKATKRYLLEVEFEQLAAAIYHAPFACLAHDRFQEGVTDPCITYANRAALELFEGNWDQMIGMPSRLTAPDGATQQERQEFLDRTANSPLGYEANHEGLRVSLTGKKFNIRGVELFNIIDFGGSKIGQAAVFREYETEDGTVVEIKSEPWQPPAVELPPSEEEVAAAEADVAAWADYVRALKAQGRGNQDPDVQNGVAELKIRKQIAEDLQKRVQDALAAAKAAFDDE